VDKVFFLLCCEQSVNFNCCTGCNYCMGGGLCFVFKWSQVRIWLYRKLVYRCSIMTRQCPCDSVGRANTDMMLVLFTMHMALCPFYTWWHAWTLWTDQDLCMAESLKHAFGKVEDI